MSGLLRLASCSAFSAAGAAHRGGPAARSSPGTPSVALLLSGGLHLAALALVLFLAARARTDEPRYVEIRAWVDPPRIVMTPPPRTADEVKIVDTIDPRGVIEPVDRQDPNLKRSMDEALRGIMPTGAILDGTKRASGGDTGGDPAPPDPGPRMIADDPREYDEPPVPVFAPEPVYPPIALEAGIEGRVFLEALVGRDGAVREVKIKSGDPILAASAQKAVQTWRFKPGRWRGRAVTTWVAVPVLFRIH